LSAVHFEYKHILLGGSSSSYSFMLFICSIVIIIIFAIRLEHFTYAYLWLIVMAKCWATNWRRRWWLLLFYNSWLLILFTQFYMTLRSLSAKGKEVSTIWNFTSNDRITCLFFFCINSHWQAKFQTEGAVTIVSRLSYCKTIDCLLLWCLFTLMTRQ
jgi:hypothetical protein